MDMMLSLLPEIIEKGFDISGFSSEKTYAYNSYVYKISYDRSRWDFLKSQIKWLVQFADKHPDNALNVYATGYSLEKDIFMVKMDHVESKHFGKRDHLVSLFRIIDGFRTKQKHNKFLFSTYINYIKDVYEKNVDEVKKKIDFDFDFDMYINELNVYEQYLNTQQSFCHGDMTIDNVLINLKDQAVLIDPNYKTDMWQSYLLDIAKIYQSLHGDEDNIVIYQKVAKEVEKMAIDLDLTYDQLHRIVSLLEISHFIRMFPYIIKSDHIEKIKHTEIKFQNILEEYLWAKQDEQ